MRAGDRVLEEPLRVLVVEEVFAGRAQDEAAGIGYQPVQGMYALSAGGMSTMQAIQACTRVAAEACGVLDKVGTFGFLRYCLPLFPEASRILGPWVIALCVIGILYGAVLISAPTVVAPAFNTSVPEGTPSIVPLLFEQQAAERPEATALVYEDQSGALNESISDVFGSMVKQWKLQQSSARADWLIGAGIMGPTVGKALRSMADPGNKELTWAGDDQPKTMAGYIEDGDVHTNSGIPNHAFYAACIALNGNSWDKAGPIWYKSLALLTSNATFADMAKATMQSAELLYGADSKEQHAVQAAWKLVGVI